MGNVNRKATPSEMEAITATIRTAFPDLEPVFSGRGGSVAPRMRTISFRLRDSVGKYRSNVVWLHPDELTRLSADDVRRRVQRSNNGPTTWPRKPRT